MGYRKYNTAGLILDRFDIGESDVLFDIYTRDLGRVSATAQSIRSMDSKLRYNLQIYSSVDISFVRGRGIWRITYAKEQVPLYYALSDEPKKVAVMLNIFSLLHRLVAEDLSDPFLFVALNDGLHFLANHDLGQNAIRLTEHLIVLRILTALGYLRLEDSLRSFITPPRYSKSIIDTFENVSEAAVKKINESLNNIQI